MNLTIKTTYTTQSEIEISLPAFYKSAYKYSTNDYVAIIDVEVMVKAYHTDTYSSISNQTTENRDAEIAKIHKEYELCTEEEFFEVFNKAYASLELMPQIKFSLPQKEIAY